ncbi:hypothetical protein FOZG_09367 [Fusarium oxysporum Fo47]|uniref:Uncharacterized protein n=1 Tax=Fusarium oxysporum Fo47 TaxID=660027 RepID=W9K8T2_FUSOX|nr:hypothetical protein FOZG_09367 [Fusarium oxysporum Fo47]
MGLRHTQPLLQQLQHQLSLWIANLIFYLSQRLNNLHFIHQRSPSPSQQQAPSSALPSYEPSHLSSKTNTIFLRFLDDLNRAAVASPPVQILGMVGGIVSMIPLHTAQIVGNSVNAAATLSTYAISKSRSELCISTANKELFMPRGLKAEFAKLDAVARYAKIPILDGNGKIEKNSMVLGPCEDVSAQSSLTVQQRRLQAIEPWIAPLDLTPLPELHVPDNFVSKMHVSTSERQRKKEENKMTKDRAKAHEDWTEDSRKARKDYEKEMRKIEEEFAKTQRKHADEPRKLEKELKKLDKEREKCQKEYEKEMRKANKDRRKDDKEEEGVRKVLWLLIRPIGNEPME